MLRHGSFSYIGAESRAPLGEDLPLGDSLVHLIEYGALERLFGYKEEK